MDPEEAAKHFTAEEQEALPEIWLTASRGSLWMGDFTAVHTIENLQNIILVGIFLVSFWVLLVLFLSFKRRADKLSLPPEQPRSRRRRLESVRSRHQDGSGYGSLTTGC